MERLHGISPLATNKKIEDSNIHMAKTFIILKAIITIIQRQVAHIIIENDSFIAIKTINEEINSPSKTFTF